MLFGLISCARSFNVLEASGLEVSTLNLELGSYLNFCVDLYLPYLVIDNVESEKLIALRKLQKFERIRAIALNLQEVLHKLDFLELAGELEAASAKYVCLLLYNFMKVLEGLFDGIFDLVLSL